MIRNLPLIACALLCSLLQLNAQSVNLASGKSTLQSSTFSTGASSLAVDDNTNGDYNSGSVTQTNNEANAWWQVDLESVSEISLIKLYNRTDAFSERLSNFYIFISDTDLSSRSFTDILSDCTVDYIHVSNEVSNELYIPKEISGRYVRIQLMDTNVLSLAEVQIYQSTLSNSVCSDLCLIDDFDDKLNGSIRGQSDWETNPPGALDGAIVDSDPPEAFIEKALMIDAGGVDFRGNAYKPLTSQSIPEGNIGTLFFFKF